MSTVPNNLRSQTPDKSSNPSNNRRVRVSDGTHTNRPAAAHKASRVKFDFNSLGVFERSLMEQKVLPAYTPVKVHLRRRQADITGQTLTLRLSLCPGLLSHQVTTKRPQLDCPAQLLLSPGSSTAHTHKHLDHRVTVLDVLEAADHIKGNERPANLPAEETPLSVFRTLRRINLVPVSGADVTSAQIAQLTPLLSSFTAVPLFF